MASKWQGGERDPLREWWGIRTKNSGPGIGDGSRSNFSWEQYGFTCNQKESERVT